MRYKSSKFNYYTEDENGNIIILNTYTGTRSIHKVNNEKKEKVLDLMKCKAEENDESSLFKKMIEYGFLVDENCDEEQKLKLMYLKGINDGKLNLVILPTEQCNYRCKYCYESFERGRMSQEIQDSIVKYVQDNICEYKGLNVSWFGGEPLLAVDIIESLSKRFIEICKKRRVPYVSDITSNGYLLNIETFKKLYKCHVYNYTITIDGVRKTHDAQKPLANGGKTFDVVVNNLLEIKNKIKNNFFSILIRTNFTKEIYENLEEYVDFFYERFNDDKRFSFLARPAGDWGGSEVLKFSSSLMNEDSFAKVFEKMLTLNKTLNYKKHLDFMNPFGSICMFSKINTLLIDSIGYIRKCSCDLNNEGNIIGRINSDGTMHIDENQKAKWVELYSPCKICTNCFFAPACLSISCLANKVLQREDITKCHVYEKNYLEYILKLVDKAGEIEVLE